MQNPTRREFVAATGAGTAALAGCQAPQNTARPNIVVIFLDDAGYADLDGWGAESVFETPAIERLTQRGIKCTQAYVTCSVCGPSRAGLMTGRHQDRFGFQTNITPHPIEDSQLPPLGLPRSERTIGSYLSEAGYATGVIGKWHLGQPKPFRPRNRGFDYFFGFLGGSRDYTPQPQHADKNWYSGKRLRENGDLYPERGDWYTTDLFTEKALGFMERHRDSPYFLYLSHNAIHTPIQAKPEDMAYYDHIDDEETRKVGAMIRAADRSVRRVVEHLEQTGQLEDTLLILTNDNGASGTTPATRNDPFRGQKAGHYEGGIRVPWVTHWPAEGLTGDEYDKPISTLDVVPTALAAANADDNTSFDGVNLLPYLRGEGTSRPHETLYWYQGIGTPSTIRDGDWKLIYDEVAREPTHLFNIAADPYEEDDRLGERPAIRQRLTGKLEDWRLACPPPRWLHAEKRLPEHGRVPEWEDETSPLLRWYHETRS